MAPSRLPCNAKSDTTVRVLHDVRRAVDDKLPKVEKGVQEGDDLIMMAEPGLSIFAENPAGVHEYLAPLLKHARSQIPPSRESETPLFLLATADSIDVESLVTDGDDDKVNGALGVPKTIWTVVSCIEPSPDILSQVQKVIIPIIRFTLENKLIDFFDNMYDLVDALPSETLRVGPSKTEKTPKLPRAPKQIRIQYFQFFDPTLAQVQEENSLCTRYRAFLNTSTSSQPPVNIRAPLPPHLSEADSPPSAHIPAASTTLLFPSSPAHLLHCD
ncbi:hypothetical protein P692DRAFT_20877950 [Suillus brevipes Sb2]|nr:hypothetical protein P692DRAFT_20877950 [Suillus brevipes Sb2]